MSYRLLYTQNAMRNTERTPAALADCIQYHLEEMERADHLPGQRLSFPYPEGMGYFFQCHDNSTGTTDQLLARYRVEPDEVSLRLLALACYPVADPPTDDEA